MQFRYSPTSPHARKFRVMIREKGLLGRVREIPGVITKQIEGVPAGDPMRQVCTIIDVEGRGWTEPPHIAQFIDSVGAGPKLVPEREAERMAALRVGILADGALDIGISLIHVGREPDGDGKTYSVDRWTKASLAGLNALEQLSPKVEPLTVGVISLGCALTWIDKNLPNLAWKPACPKLAKLQTALEKRPSFKDTAPA